MQPFRNLDVWRKAHTLTLDIYRITEGFPKTETFGLATQLRRSSMTISMKIAEGCGREGLEFGRCLQQARATGVELEYLLLLAYDLHLIDEPAHEVLQAQLIEVRKMLSGFMKTLLV